MRESKRERETKCKRAGQKDFTKAGMLKKQLLTGTHTRTHTHTHTHTHTVNVTKGDKSRFHLGAPAASQAPPPPPQENARGIYGGRRIVYGPPSPGPQPLFVPMQSFSVQPPLFTPTLRLKLGRAEETYPRIQYPRSSPISGPPALSPGIYVSVNVGEDNG